MQKNTLSKLQKFIPVHFLSIIQYIHACLLSHWILRWGSQPIRLSTASVSLVKEAIAESGIKVELFQYPIWIFWRAPLFILLKLRDIAPAYRLSVAQVQSQKQQAIAAYSSQIATLHQGFIKRFLEAEEIFLKTEY